MQYIVMFTASNGRETYISTVYGMDQPVYTSDRAMAHRFPSMPAAAEYLARATEGNEDEQALVPCDGDTVELVPVAKPEIKV